jgi:hypothetical protein
MIFIYGLNVSRPHRALRLRAAGYERIHQLRLVVFAGWVMLVVRLGRV